MSDNKDKTPSLSDADKKALGRVSVMKMIKKMLKDKILKKESKIKKNNDKFKKNKKCLVCGSERVFIMMIDKTLGNKCLHGCNDCGERMYL